MAAWTESQCLIDPQFHLAGIGSHAQIPTPLELPNVVRIYFSTRPRPQFSIIVYADISKETPHELVKLHTTPLLAPGERGLFDEDGTMPQLAISHGQEVWLYYSGWQRRVTVPYSNWIGLCKSNDGGETFFKYSAAPVIDRSHANLYSATALFARRINCIFAGAYTCGEGWREEESKLEEVYNIRLAFSNDGLDWNFARQPCIRKRSQDEACTRPTILPIENGWVMAFCYRRTKDFRDGKHAYRIGFAVSKDFWTWHRLRLEDEIVPERSDWDAYMQAYPFLLRVNDSVWLFHSGNGFGQGGFGISKMSYGTFAEYFGEKIQEISSIGSESGKF